MVNQTVIFGAGGHCRTVCSVAGYNSDLKIIAIADRTKDYLGEEICDVKIEYCWDDINEIYENGIRYALIAIGDNTERELLYKKLIAKGFNVPTIIHPSAVIEKDAVIGKGTLIGMGVKIATGVSIGENSIIYTGSVIDHESKIGSHVLMSPACAIAGRVSIGDGCFIGIGSVVKDQITIGKNVTVGAGAVVVKNVCDGEVVVGVPAKPLNE